jgi:peptidoglycan/xylan/chitin deacetylase (PgdA/CDA1 family)
MSELVTIQTPLAWAKNFFCDEIPHLPGGREIKLTFDDGPNPDTTLALLDQLRAFAIKATFFVRGQNLTSTRGRKILERIAADGHQVGNHTYSHKDLTRLPSSQVEDEITRTENLIGACDKGIKLLRPPNGTQDASTENIIRKLGYRSVFWNVDSLDWHKKFMQGRWVAHVVEQIKYHEHSVVLAHDIHPTTVAHFPRLVSAIRRLPDARFVPLT